MTKVELDDIQGIIVGAYGKLRAATFVLLRITEPEAARSWLRGIAGEVRKASDGVPDSETCVNIAFTYSGLKELKLPAQALGGFSREFQEGMWDNPRRRRILGDLGKSDPDHWSWGGCHNESVHVLLLYALDSDSLAALYESHRARFADGGLEEVHDRLDSYDIGDLEHFGFRDGLSQPKIAGLTRTTDENQIVAAGEFILGYPNGYEQFTNRPFLDPIHDREGLLPQDANGTDQRDFGKDGSYLVFRQMKQDVEQFWRFIDDETKDASGASDPEASDRVAAKMVGRWRSGAPLVLSPDQDDPAWKSANDFLYHREDADGLKCPVGAHIRRSNPRDSLEPRAGTRTAIETTNRHRIIRRGRPYGVPLAESLTPKDFLNSPEGKGERGLLFLCFAANINRQFEFIQNSWVNNPNFAGLYTDSDPLIGDRRGGGDTFTIPEKPLRKRVHGLPRFVDVKGGDYFFMPGIRALRFLAEEHVMLASCYSAPAQAASSGLAPPSLRLMRLANRIFESLMRLARKRIFVGSRNAFDLVLRRSLVSLTQHLINFRRKKEQLQLAEERPVPREEEIVRQITKSMTGFLFKHYRNGIAERAGNTKTYGLLKASFEVRTDLREDLRIGVLQPGKNYRAYVRFGGPGPLVTPDIENNGILSVGVKLMGVEGEKLSDDEKHTQDFLGISAPTFTTPNIIENVKLQEHLYQDIGVFYFLNPLDSHYLDAVMQGLYSKTYTSPLEVRYWSCGPYAFGAGRAIQFSFQPATRFSQFARASAYPGLVLSSRSWTSSVPQFR